MRTSEWGEGWMCILPQRYPSCAVSGRGRSRRCDGGSCAAGTATRSFRSGSGRFCCRSGRRVCPVVVMALAFVSLHSSSVCLFDSIAGLPCHDPYLRQHSSYPPFVYTCHRHTSSAVFDAGADSSLTHVHVIPPPTNTIAHKTSIREDAVPCQGRSSARRRYRRKSSWSRLECEYRGCRCRVSPLGFVAFEVQASQS